MKPNTRSPSYLIRNPYSYCFRITVPKDLQDLVRQKEIRYSLKTGCLGLAKQKARFLAGQVQQLFRFLRREAVVLNNLTDDLIQKLVQKYIRSSVKAVEESFYESHHDEKKEQYLSRGLPPYNFRAFLGSLDRERELLLGCLNMGSFAEVDNEAMHLLEENKIEILDKRSPQYRKFCADLMKAKINLIPIRKKIYLCDPSYKEDLRNTFSEIFSEEREESQDSETVKKVFDEFWQENEPNWKPRTIPEYRTIGKHLIEFLGPNTKIRTVNYEKAREYKKAVMEKRGRGGKKLSVSRVNMYLGFASQFFNYAKRNHYVDENPFEGLQVSTKKAKRPDEQRDIFTQEELKKIFCESEEYLKDLHKEAHYFWVPLLGLYTGCRLEEICQLYVEDVIQENGIWCLKIDQDKPDKSVKTSEKRKVPLHPFLVEDLKFVDYVKSLKDQKGRVFPKLKRIRDRYSHAISSKWFKRFLKRCGIEAPTGRKVFHSFRHTFITNLKEKDVPEQYIAEIVGHSISGETSGRYGKRYSVEKLYNKAILKVDYGIDLKHLKKSKYVKG